ncbi:MAG TPA: GIY-YIG nuclease family protein [Ktedonobacterales bacterium]|nr:GIY-YIG nuclease family protein [Ktedonobacterales bacterium]
MSDEREQAHQSAAIALFDDETAEKAVRRVWHEDRWFFSVVDVISLLTGSASPSQYWRDMKRRIYDEGFREVRTAYRQLKLPAADGKLRETDCADFPTLATLLHALPALYSRTTPHRPLTSSPNTCDSGIYAIVNTLTRDRYIGSSHDMPSRFTQHKALLRRGKHHARRLQAAWDTYGEDAFVFVVLEALPDTDQLEAIEQRYLDTEQPAYNSAASAQNRLTLPPIAEDRLHRLLFSLYDLQSADPNVQTSFIRTLREAIGYGVVKPSRNFPVFLAAAASGVATWAAFGTFMQQREQAG